MPLTIHPHLPQVRLFPMALALLALPLMMAPELNAQKAKPAVLPCKITGAIRFTDGTLSGLVKEADVRSMGERKLRVGEGADTFVKLDGKLVTTPTLDAYGKAMKDGGSIESWFGAAMAVPYVRGLGVLEFLRKSVDSRVSHFSERWMGALSVGLIDYDESADKARREADVQAGKTLLDYAAAGKIKKLHRKGGTLTYSSSYQDHEIEWLASGDLDRDGAEDRLIQIKSWSREGRAAYTMTYVVSWKKRSEKCASVRPYPEDNIVAR